MKWIEPFESYFSVLGLRAATYLGFGKDVRRAEADYGRLNLRNISSLAGYIIGSVVTRKSGASLRFSKIIISDALILESRRLLARMSLK